MVGCAFHYLNRFMGYSIKASLVASTTEVFTIMDRDMVRSACARFRGPIKADVEANGDLI